jgi:signal transduction histidine kinase
MTARLWRVVAVYRVITLGYAAVLILRYDHLYAHPGAGLAALLVMTVWTAVTVIAYRRDGAGGDSAGGDSAGRDSGRAAWLIAVDLGLAIVLVLSTRWIDTHARVAGGAPTIPSLWAAAPVLACAVAGGRRWGLAGAVALCAADLAEQPGAPSTSTVYGMVLVLIAGGVGGYIVRLALDAERAIARAARREAAAAERQRIARDVHDSVLQVLALVASRGAALGGEAAELGRLAGEQEAALRGLLTADDEGEAAPDPAASVDLRTRAEKFGGAGVTVSCPATPVMVGASTAEAITGAVAEALDNVRAHAGLEAHAWLLLEDDGMVVTVSVRDDGRGFAPGRLAEAAAAGRLGVSQSIVGRLGVIGGTATVTSSPGGGTEVELNVSRS